MSSLSSVGQAVADKPKRSSVEKIVVRSIILGLAVVVGAEFFVQKKYEKDLNAIFAALEKSESDVRAKAMVSNFDLAKLLGGRKPDFQGHPGQIMVNSKYYECYVYKSILKRRFLAPPEVPEKVSMYALYSGEVRPDLIKYRVGEPQEKMDFFSAYRFYVYYGDEDPKTHVREVIHVTPDREKFIDEIRKPPSKEELKKLHEMNLARMVADMAKGGKIMTKAEIDAEDSWLHPKPEPSITDLKIPGWKINPKTGTLERDPSTAPAPDREPSAPPSTKEPGTESKVIHTPKGESLPIPAKTEPAKTEPAKTEPAKTEPAKTEPAKTEPAKTEPAKTEPAKTEPAKTEPAKTEPAKTEPAKTEPAKTEPAKKGAEKK